MTFFEMISNIAQKSESVFLYDFSENLENRDLSEVRIRELTTIDDLYDLNCSPFNVDINLNILKLSSSKVNLYGKIETFYGLCCKNNGKLMFQHIFQNSEQYRWEYYEKINLHSITVNNLLLTVIECDYALTVVYCILSLFEVYKCYNLIFFQYLLKCSLGFNVYNENNLKKSFLFSFSETPLFIDAINHIGLKKISNRNGLALKEYDIFISDIFKAVYADDTIKNYISQNFSMNQLEVSLLINDIYTILKRLEIAL